MIILQMLSCKDNLRIVFIFYLLTLLTGCDSSPEVSTAKQKEENAISEVSAARAKAFNNGDALGIAIHFTEDAFLMAPGKPAIRGRQAVQSYYQSIFDKYNAVLESKYDEVFVSGRLGYGKGFAKVILISKSGGDSLFSTSKYINIMQKQPDGTWKTTHDIWNDNEELTKKGSSGN